MNERLRMEPVSHVPWLLVLGACTLWLVVQNALLLTVATYLHPSLPVDLAVATVRLLARLLLAGQQALAGLAAVEAGALPFGFMLGEGVL